MDLKQMQYFVTVADEGSITAGAKKLFITQPPLSMQLKELEEELGCTLFERGPRQISLTEPGKILYKHAKTLLSLSHVTKEEVLTAANPQKGTIRIGMVSSLVCARALCWLAGFAEKYTEIDFEITEGNTYQLLEQLHAGTIHMALIRTPYATERTESVSMARDRMVAVGRKDFFEGCKSVSPRMLADQPLILYRRWEQTVRHAFSAEDLKPHVRILADDSRTVVKAAELGMGIALVPQSATDVLSAEGCEVRSIEGWSWTSSMDIVKTKNGYLPGCANLFLEYLKDLAAQEA